MQGEATRAFDALKKWHGEQQNQALGSLRKPFSRCFFGKDVPFWLG